MGKSNYYHMLYFKPWGSWERHVGNPSQGRISICKVTEGNKFTECPLCTRDFPISSHLKSCELSLLPLLQVRKLILSQVKGLLVSHTDS